MRKPNGLSMHASVRVDCRSAPRLSHFRQQPGTTECPAVTRRRRWVRFDTLGFGGLVALYASLRPPSGRRSQCTAPFLLRASDKPLLDLGDVVVWLRDLGLGRSSMTAPQTQGCRTSSCSPLRVSSWPTSLRLERADRVNRLGLISTRRR